jgi:pentatricopeptide repeat protein
MFAAGLPASLHVYKALPLNIMSVAGLPASLHVYNALLYAHSVAGELEEAAALYLGLRARGLAPALETFTSLFAARARPATPRSPEWLAAPARAACPHARASHGRAGRRRGRGTGAWGHLEQG